MKTLFLFLALVLTPALINAQGYIEPANTIIITLPDSVNAHKKASRVFIDNGGYRIISGMESPSSVFIVEKTGERNTKMVLRLEINGSELVLTGKFKSLAKIYRQANRDYRKNRESRMIITWFEMVDLAKALGANRKYELR